MSRFTELSAPALVNPFEIVAGPPGDRSLYVTDAGSSHIFRVSLQGTITPVTTNPALTNTTQSITIGPDNNIWVTEGGNSVDRITSNGTLTPFITTHPVGGQTITSDTNGNIWFTEFGSGFFGRVTLPNGPVLDTFPVPVGTTNPSGLVFAPDGSLWAAIRGTPDQIVQMTVSGNTLLNPKTIGLTAGSLPFKLIRGPGGNLWFSEYGGGRIGYITPTGTLKEDAVQFGDNPGPQGLAYDAAHNVLWFAEFNAGRIGRLTLSGTTVTFTEEFPVPSATIGPTDTISVALDPDGNVWFTEHVGRIGRFIP